jgi:hypothetical protein
MRLCAGLLGVAGIIILTFVTRASAGLKEGLEAVAANDYKRAYEEMLPLAEQGDPIAQTELARLYGTGNGVTRDDTKAVMWYRRAAQSGEKAAQVNLAIKYELGHGVPRDYAEAMQWFRRAADAGAEDGLIGLANMYEQGLGVTPDSAMALRLLTKAAERDNPLAQYQVGVHYWQGRGATRDSASAYRWFLKSANQAYTPAMASIGMMYFGDGLPFDPVHGCAWLTLAQRAGFDAKNETDRLNFEFKKRCEGLPPESQNAVKALVSEWKPREIWLERKRRMFQELLRKAAEEDAQRASKATH